jgi:hypothetical protein
MVIHRPLPDIASLQANLLEVLQEIFFIRAANVVLDWKCRWVDFIRCCFLKDSLVMFNRNNFIQGYLSNSNRLQHKDMFMKVCERLRKVKVSSWKRKVRALDYFNLLSWYVSKSLGQGGNKYKEPQVVRSLLAMAVDVDNLADEGLFKRLLQVYRG